MTLEELLPPGAQKDSCKKIINVRVVMFFPPGDEDLCEADFPLWWEKLG